MVAGSPARWSTPLPLRTRPVYKHEELQWACMQHPHCVAASLAGRAGQAQKGSRHPSSAVQNKMGAFD